MVMTVKQMLARSARKDAEAEQQPVDDDKDKTVQPPQDPAESQPAEGPANEPEGEKAEDEKNDPVTAGWDVAIRSTGLKVKSPQAKRDIWSR